MTRRIEWMLALLLALWASGAQAQSSTLRDGLQAWGQRRANVAPPGAEYEVRFHQGFEAPCLDGVDPMLCDTPATRETQSPKRDEYSVSFWFKADAPVNPGDAVPLVNKGNYYSEFLGWNFFVEADNAGQPWLIFRVCGKDPFTSSGNCTSSFPNMHKAAIRKPVQWGRWYHVVGIIDQYVGGTDDARHELRLYVDGVATPLAAPYSGGGGASTHSLPATTIDISVAGQPPRVAFMC